MKRSSSVMSARVGASKLTKRRKMSKKTSRKFTTLRRQPDGPFPASKRITMVYENALTPISGAAAF